MSPTRPAWPELAGLALVVVVFAALLGRSASYDYVWDDVPEIAQSAAFDRPLAEGITLTQTQRAVPELAHAPALQFGYDSYRPLLFTSYWCDIHLWGRGPAPLHRTNVLLGALAVLLAYAVARRWLGSPYALIPTALFALHPIQIETVAYISARGDLLAGLFGLATAYAALRAIDTERRGPALAWTAGAGIAFGASLLSKESGLALPLAIGALVATRGAAPRRWWIAVALLALAVAYLPLRGALVTTTTHPPYGEALVGLPGALLEYLRIAVLPLDLSIERLPHPSYIALGWVVAAVVLAGGGLLAKRGRAPWVGTALAGAAWALVLLAPSAVALRTTSVVADRYAYAALFGAGITVAAAASGLVTARPRLARIAATLAAVWALALLVVGWQQVPVWADTLSLYSNAMAMAPDSARAQYRVAVLAIQADRWDLALPRLARALELDPENVEALNNLGVYQLRTMPADAEATLRRAVVAAPAHYRAWLNLGLAQLAQGHHDAGCASIARALAIDPGYAAGLAEQRRSCVVP